jgi:drug/metabolite transporter (DMT)-like permease
LEGNGFSVFVVSGVMGIGVGDVAFFQALPRLGSRLAVLLVQCTVAPLAAIIEWLWLGTTLTVAQVACGVAIVAGLVLALGRGAHVDTVGTTRFAGLAWALLAALGGAVGAVLSRKAYALAALEGSTPDGATAAFQRVLGGVLLSGVAVLVAKGGRVSPGHGTLSMNSLEASGRKWREAWLWVFMNALAGMTVGVSFMQEALQTTPAGLVMAIIALTPITVIPLAYWFEGERPTRRSLLGGVVAVAGAVLLILFRNR